jgi:hypothetical protein
MSLKNLSIISVVAVLIAAVFMMGFSFGVLTASKNITNNANLITDVNLSVYGSETSTEELLAISWGNILPTQEKTAELWIQNDADINMVISFATSNWIPPSAQDEIAISFAEGNPWPMAWTLPPHYRKQAIITLTAGANCTSGSFSFTLHVIGTVTG